MYDWQIKLFGKEHLYLAGPACFYTNGYTLWDALRRKAEYHGFHVTMPSDNQLDFSSPDLRDHAKAIFQNCAACMNESTAILVDLEAFRGAEPDGGSIFELGMAYARGLRCYGYTRDKRPMVWKYQGVQLRDDTPCDRQGRALPYPDLPFSPCIVGSSRLVQGGFEDCLQLLMLDLEEAVKSAVLAPPPAPAPQPAPVPHARPLVYLADAGRYAGDAAARYVQMKAVCAQYGLDAVSPLDFVPDDIVVNKDAPYEVAAQLFHRYQRHVRDCDILLADLNDFSGYEPSSDVSFECGMAFQLGKKCFGYLSDATPMRDRVPNYGEAREYRDECGRNAENFDYPLNLMFAGSMPVFEAQGFEQAVQQLAQALA